MAVQVHGLAELHRAFKVASKEVAKDVQEAIKQAGEPIRQDAQNRMMEFSRISRGKNVKTWHTIKLGIERQTTGYIVPATKATFSPRSRYSRRKFIAETAQKELEARDSQQHRVEAEFRDALNEVARTWARV